MIKNTVLSLVLASSMSVSAFAATVKTNIPETSFSQLKQQAAKIKKNDSAKMTDQQVNEFRNTLEIMKSVNLSTEKEFIPALDANLQRWAKEDIVVLKNALTYIKIALKSRQSQYDNLTSIAKNGKAPKEINERLYELKQLTNESQEKITEFTSRVKAIEEANLFIADASKIVDIEDFWIPALAGDKNNILILKTTSIEQDNFAKLAATEEKLTTALASLIKKSEYYSSVSLVS